MIRNPLNRNAPELKNKNKKDGKLPSRLRICSASIVPSPPTITIQNCLSSYKKESRDWDVIEKRRNRLSLANIESADLTH